MLNGVDLFGFSRLRDLSDRCAATVTTHTMGSGTTVAVSSAKSGSCKVSNRARRSRLSGTVSAHTARRRWRTGSRVTAFRVSMVGYIGGDYLRNSTSDTPGGVRVVNVTGDGFLPTGRNSVLQRHEPDRRKQPAFARRAALRLGRSEAKPTTRCSPDSVRLRNQQLWNRKAVTRATG